MAQSRIQERVSAITLGTAQLGMPYGLGDGSKGLAEDTVQAILDAARDCGIRAFDTAQAYGEAELRLGRWLARHSQTHAPFIVSKFPALRETDEAGDILRNLDRSCADLGVGRIDLYLAHRGRDLLRPGVADLLRQCTAAGKIGGFGGSIYEVEDAKALLEIPELTALQMPVHLANRSAADSGLLEAAACRGVAIFARSVFLQGLLLADPATLAPAFSPAAVVLARLEALAREHKTTRAVLALAAVRAFPAVTSIVIGVDSVIQLAQNLASFQARVDPAAIAKAFAIARDFPPDLSDPRRWKR